MKIYTNDDIRPGVIAGQKIAIIGYGSQGRAHAQNLKDSGHDVIVGVREGGKGWKNAKADGLATAEPADAVKDADIIAILTPDMAQAEVYKTQIEPFAKKGSALLFAHGFSIIYGRVTPREDMDVILVAPKGPGDLVRREYQKGAGVPSLFAIEKDVTGKARDRAMGYAKGNGGATGGLLETTFREETETDLFGEQAVLCGGAKELVMGGFNTLVEAGYQPEIAYFECLHELKLIVDLFYEGGITKMNEFISETAKWGSVKSGPRVINDETLARMKQILTEIQDGTFAREWIAENDAGKPNYDALVAEDNAQKIEVVGASLRERMAWLHAPKTAEAA
ncbi:Ketol-acid reductoisomerase (NADP(+)) [Brevundimonas sp. NIBR10]|uniref:ketol-acid reductoisomerase n=1 Tax=Brevundimonas sp. NIBR10 TaxID=3015997 RepID=UPI0022F1CF10|nr:ketol-acid reductoisomerase [Brevundimonas sp. NIBR10]WGM48808.1 Ketol-acid reductoisomerase (NADP(+)) [Brevundimonas sp. NIBR10]